MNKRRDLDNEFEGEFDDEFEDLPGDLEFASMEFGTLMPDIGLPNKFMLTPWEELRRQLTLFLKFVAPEDDSHLSVRHAPTPDIEERCDQWIRMFVSAKDRKGIVPPSDLQRWLVARACMALALVNYEISIQKQLYAPDLKNHFAEAINLRLIQFWHECGKADWLRNDPNKRSTTE